jgi:molybdopterin molybdotransferase
MRENVDHLISVAEAMAIIDALPVRPRRRTVPLHEAAGLRLAEDLRADRDYPPFDKSLMDGYAVRSADTLSAPAELQVIGESAAGQALVRAIEAGQAMAIMTGAPLPQGADAVVPIEATEPRGEFVTAGNRVRILDAAKSGHAIAARGSDIQNGTVVLPAGAMLLAPQIAVAACVGAANVAVWDRPSCAILASGDEIIPVDQSPRPEQIRNSNNPMLACLLTRLECAVHDLGIVADRPAEIAARIGEGLRHDVLFVTGGMSMGQYDYVPRILAELGGRMMITKLRIRPGKPFVLAEMPDGKYVVGLPGNPVSAFVCTLRLAARLLSRIAGGSPGNRMAHLPLIEAVPSNGPREFYQPAMIEAARVRPLVWKGSADIFTLARADALIIRAENAAPLAAGEMVTVLLLD